MKKVKDGNVDESSSVSPITAVISLSKGFACSAGPGTVSLFEKTGEDGYRKSRNILVNSDKQCMQTFTPTLSTGSFNTELISPLQLSNYLYHRLPLPHLLGESEAEALVNSLIVYSLTLVLICCRHKRDRFYRITHLYFTVYFVSDSF